MLRSNVALNEPMYSDTTKVSVETLNWLDEPLPALLASDDEKNCFDTILIADCIYKHAPLQALVNVICNYANENTRIWMTCEKHDPESFAAFERFAQASSLQIEPLTTQGKVYTFELRINASSASARLNNDNSVN